MQEQNLNFDQAFTEIIKREHEIKTAADESQPWDGLPTIEFDQWLDDAIKRQKERPKHVEAIEEHVEAIEWQPGKRLLIRGSEAVFVD